MQTRLFSMQMEKPRIWPVMFSMASLMMLLLPTLLLALSPEKSTTLPLSLSTPNALPPKQNGPVESLSILASKTSFEITASIRTTDVLASTGDVEQKKWTLNTLQSLQNTLRQIKKLDPKRNRITIYPAAESLTEDVVHWMDVIRQDKQGTLFPEIIITRNQQ